MNQIPLKTPRTLTRACAYSKNRVTGKLYSTSGGGSGGGAAPRPASAVPAPPQSSGSSKVLPAVLLLGGGAAGLGGYYYYDPNADLFKAARSALGMEQPKKQAEPVKPLVRQPSPAPTPIQKQQEVKKQSVQKTEEKAKVGGQGTPQTQQQKSAASPSSIAVPPPPLPKASAVNAAAAATTAAAVVAPVIASPPVPTPAPTQTQAAAPEVKSSSSGAAEATGENVVPKKVLVTALRAQQEALSEAHEEKVKVIQEDYDRKLKNATQVIEAERVVDLRAKYEKASAALTAIEQGIEARTDQNARAKRLRALWAQVNALHARVNHPEYHNSTVTSIDKKRLISAIEIPDKFVTQMVDSLPAQPVHSLESLKQRFYSELEPVAKSVTLMKDGDEFSIWKYALGKMFGSALARVNRTETTVTPSSSPVQQTANALDTARNALEQSDLLSAAIAINQLKGLPRQVASDWLSDARTLLETNQTLFVLMTYAASNNVF